MNGTICHHILIHGVDIIQNEILPIGMISEEALEARSKDFRFIRELENFQKRNQRKIFSNKNKINIKALMLCCMLVLVC